MLIFNPYFIYILPDCAERTVRRYLSQLTTAFRSWNDDAADVRYFHCYDLLKIAPDVKEPLGNMKMNINDMVDKCRNMQTDSAAVGIVFGCSVEQNERREEWKLEMRLTMIPSVRCSLDYDFSEKNSVTGEYDFFKHFLRHRLAGIVRYEPMTDVGYVHALYLCKKISAIPQLEELDCIIKFRGTESPIKIFADAAKKVLSPPETASQFVELYNDRESVSEFLRKCDQQLMSTWGESRFEGYLNELPVTLEVWLSP